MNEIIFDVYNAIAELSTQFCQDFIYADEKFVRNLESRKLQFVKVKQELRPLSLCQATA